MIDAQSPIGEMLLGRLEGEARRAGSKARGVATKRFGQSACVRCASEERKSRLFCGGCGRPFGTPEEVAILTEKRALEKKLSKTDKRRGYH